MCDKKTADLFDIFYILHQAILNALGHFFWGGECIHLASSMVGLLYVGKKNGSRAKK